MKDRNNYDPGQQYDNYYKDGENSIYHKRYKGKVIPRDEWMLLEQSKEVLSKHEGDTMRILDHGFGDGRYFHVIEQVAKQAEKKGKSVELIAYDPSSGGLKTFADRLKGEGGYEGLDGLNFREISEAKKEFNVGGYDAGVISKGNLKVNFIHNDIGDSMEHTKNLVGNVDMVMSMFGVMSHIPGRKNRQDVMSMFNDITNENGRVVVTVPSPSRFKEEQQAYDKMRDQGYRPEQAPEPGDIVYTRKEQGSNKVRNYYHVFNSEELHEDLQTAGLKINGNIEANHIMDITKLTSNPVLAKFDEYISWLTPAHMVDSMSSYMSAVSSPQKEKSSSKYKTPDSPSYVSYLIPPKDLEEIKLNSAETSPTTILSSSSNSVSSTSSGYVEQEPVSELSNNNIYTREPSGSLSRKSKSWTSGFTSVKRSLSEGSEDERNERSR
jgi:hypothetical protein